jgi:hypothetical protein
MDIEFEVLLLFVPAAIYGALLLGPGFVLYRAWGRHAAATWWTVTTVAIALLVVALTAFESIASHFRTVPHGSGFEREGSDYDQFVSRSKAVFVALYVLVLVFSATVAYVRVRQHKGRRRSLAGATAAAVLMFMALSLPFVEFANSCNIGQSFVLDTSC